MPTVGHLTYGESKMTGLMYDRAMLFRRLPDNVEGAARMEQTMEGTVHACARYLRNQPEESRECFFAELTDGTRLSAEEIDRIAVAEGG